MTVSALYDLLITAFSSRGHAFEARKPLFDSRVDRRLLSLCFCQTTHTFDRLSTNFTNGLIFFFSFDTTTALRVRSDRVWAQRRSVTELNVEFKILLAFIRYFKMAGFPNLLFFLFVNH